MSFENISSEIRSNFRAYRGTCSFCMRIGHRIINCNDARIDNFDRLCKNYIISNGIASFHDFLLNQALSQPNFIKGFAIRKCNATTRDQIDVCIDKILARFSEIYLEYHNNIEQTESEGQREPITEETEQHNSLEMNNNSLIRTMNLILLENASTIQQFSNIMLLMEMAQQIGQSRTRENEKFDIDITLLEKSEDNLREKYECNICYESFEKVNFVRLNCKHEFCKDCIKKTLQNEIKSYINCALCRTEVDKIEVRNLSVKNELDNYTK